MTGSFIEGAMTIITSIGRESLWKFNRAVSGVSGVEVTCRTDGGAFYFFWLRRSSASISDALAAAC